jgi:hypothetical protein
VFLQSCSVEDCAKQAIMSGMCKKHHDQSKGLVKVRAPRSKKNSDDANKKQGQGAAAGHERGLSIFQDSETMDNIINNGVSGLLSSSS